MTTFNPKVTKIAINASGGLWTPIPLTIMASKVRVHEDPAYNGGILQGLTGYFVDTQPPQPAAVAADWNPVDGVPPGASPAAQFTWLPNNNGQEGPAFEPISFGGSEGGRVHGGDGDYVGAQGTVILWLTTNTENGSGILLEEWV